MKYEVRMAHIRMRLEAEEGMLREWYAEHGDELERQKEQQASDRARQKQSRDAKRHASLVARRVVFTDRQTYMLSDAAASRTYVSIAKEWGVSATTVRNIHLRAESKVRFLEWQRKEREIVAEKAAKAWVEAGDWSI